MKREQPKPKLRTASAIIAAVFLASCVGGQLTGAAADDLLTGFSVSDLKFQGPGEWRHSAEPIWVYDYHTLRLRYRASGLPQDATPILTLQPRSVGPVTPGATNRENPYAAGRPVVVILANQLVADSATHALEVELRGKMRTAQVVQLLYALPAKARLEVEQLDFHGDPDILPCGAAQAVNPLPDGTVKLAAHGPLACNGAPATSLRGREAVRIDGAGRKGRTLYLNVLAHFAGLSYFAPNQAVDRWRLKENRETAHVIARIQYAGAGAGASEEQYPLLVTERRHALLNRTAALYALALDPARRLASVELLDRSPHAQLVLFSAGLSQAATPEARPEPLPTPPTSSTRTAGEPDLDASKWFRIEPAKGKPAPAAALRPDLRVDRTARGRSVSLSLTNSGSSSVEFELVFPSLTVQPSSDPDDVFYLFPRQGAVISQQDAALENFYGGSFPLQFVDVFAVRANRGAALIVKDTEGTPKTFRLKKSGTAAELEVSYTLRLAPGQTFRPPDASVVFHNGDWRPGFTAYRDWLKSWHKPLGPHPDWLRSAFWCRRDYPVGGTGRLFDVRANRYTFEELIRESQVLGGADFIDISGWGLSTSAGRVGDYPIELGGAADLRANIAYASKLKIPTGLYFEGYLIDKNSAVGRRHAAAWQMIQENGEGRWWPGGSPELFVCPHIPEWHRYLAGRIVAVAREVGASAVYIDEHGFSDRRKSCYSTAHGHELGVGPLPGEIAMVREVRRALDGAGLRNVALYLEENPADTMARYYDAVFCYAISRTNPRLSPLKLNLWRFAFPDILAWDMLSTGIDPRVLSPEDFRLSLWHGNGAWLKGDADTWYGEELLVFLRKAHQLLKQHARAFTGEAEPLVASPHPAVFINRFAGGGETVYTLFNASYRTAQLTFHGRRFSIAPRDVEVVGVR
jgi:hypothetical protein